MTALWTERHDTAIEATHKALTAALEPAQSQRECKEILDGLGWPHGSFNEYVTASVKVRKVLANAAILIRTRELMLKSGAVG